MAAQGSLTLNTKVYTPAVPAMVSLRGHSLVTARLGVLLAS